MPMQWQVDRMTDWMASERRKKRFLHICAGVLAAALVVAAVVLFFGLLEPDTAQILAQEGPASVLGRDEGAITRLLGDPSVRQTGDGSLCLTYGDLIFDLRGAPPACQTLTCTGPSLPLWGLQAGVSDAEAVRKALRSAGVHAVENGFDPAYSGGGPQSAGQGWIAAYTGGSLYLFRYDGADSAQRIQEIQITSGAKRELPDNLFCCPQLTGRLDGKDPTALLGLDETQARYTYGFCGRTLLLDRDYTDAAPGALLTMEPTATYGAGADAVGYADVGDYGYQDRSVYCMLVTETGTLPVLGLTPGTSTQEEATALMSAMGALEFTREAPLVLRAGLPYASLDLEALALQPLPEDRQSFLTESWYADLRYEDGVLTRAAFCALAEPVDLTPPAPPEPEPPPPPLYGQSFQIGQASFTMGLPEAWEDLCTVEKKKDRIVFYHKAARAAGWDGILLTLGLFPDPEDYSGETDYRVLGEARGGELVALFPSGEQYDPDDQAVAQAYQAMADQLTRILDSVAL